MPLVPSHVLGIYGRGLLGLAVVGGGVLGMAHWATRRRVEEWVETVDVPVRKEVVRDALGVAEVVTVETRRITHRLKRRAPIGWNVETAELVGALSLLALAAGGGRRLALSRRDHEKEEPPDWSDGEIRRIARPDGSTLHAELFGPPDAQPIVFLHGWGSDSTEWKYARRELGERYRLILWDLPGLGRSTSPHNDDFSVDRMAADLDAVLDLAGGRPALLIGHSIGGMILLTYCRMFPESLRTRVAGLVLAHTTYTNPMRTIKNRRFLTAIEKPVLKPMCQAMAAFAPLFWVLNWFTYFNGSMQRSNSHRTFCGHETREQLDWVSRFLPKAWPSVVAKGMLGMFRFDEEATLTTVPVPTLVLMGDLDETTQPDASRLMAQRIPGAELAAIAPAKHMGLIELHRRWAEIVDDFARRLDWGGTRVTRPRP